MVAFMVEMIFFNCSLVILLHLLNKKFSDKFKLGLFSIIVPSTVMFAPIIIEANPIVPLFVGFFLFSLVFISLGYLELAIVMYALSINVNTSAIWFFPIVLF